MVRPGRARQDAGMPRIHVEIAAPEALDPALRGADFDELWQGLTGPVCREHRTRRVERVATQLGPAFAKRFCGVQPKNWLRIRWTSAPRARSQAGREAAICRLLVERGFVAPRVLLLAEELRCGRERRSLLLTAALAGQPLCADPAALADDDRLLAIATELGRVLARGIHLPDLGTDHVYLLPGGGIGLLDFTNARSAPRPRAREVARSLIRLFRSPGADALVARGVHERMAERYLDAAGRSDARAAWRRLARERLR